MKIVITGGNGYIGARLSQYLADRGNQVIPVCYPAIPDNSDWVGKMFRVLSGDIRDEKTICDIAELKADAIVHLISLDHKESEKEPGFVNEINVLPTWRLLDRCTKDGLAKFIYFSTVQVYGKLPNSEIDESFPTNPVNIYGLTHLLSENICDHFNRNTSTNVITVRLSNSYGEPVFPDNNCWWLVINDLCRGAYINKEIRLHSDGTPQRDFIHGDDVCNAINFLLNSELRDFDNNIYHISSAITFTLIELAFIIKEIYFERYGKIIPIIANGKLIKDNDSLNPVRYYILNQKIRSHGFVLNIQIKDGVEKLFHFMENYSEKIAW